VKKISILLKLNPERHLIIASTKDRDYNGHRLSI